MKTLTEALDVFFVKGEDREKEQELLEAKQNYVRPLFVLVDQELAQEETRVRALGLCSAMFAQVASPDFQMRVLLDPTLASGLVNYTLQVMIQGILIGAIMYREELEEKEIL